MCWVGLSYRLALPRTMWETCRCPRPCGAGAGTGWRMSTTSVSYWRRSPPWCTTSAFQSGSTWTSSGAWTPLGGSIRRWWTSWGSISESQVDAVTIKSVVKACPKVVGSVFLKYLFFFPNPLIFLYPRKLWCWRQPKSLQLGLEMHSLFVLFNHGQNQLVSRLSGSFFKSSKISLTCKRS